FQLGFDLGSRRGWDDGYRDAKYGKACVVQTQHFGPYTTLAYRRGFRIGYRRAYAQGYEAARCGVIASPYAATPFGRLRVSRPPFGRPAYGRPSVGRPIFGRPR
ncbi:MAG: hypothetical protein ACYTGC_08850, partial [Planctomycetota bacterium]